MKFVFHTSHRCLYLYVPSGNMCQTRKEIRISPRADVEIISFRNEIVFFHYSIHLMQLVNCTNKLRSKVKGSKSVCDNL